MNNTSSDGEARVTKKFISTILQRSNLLAQLVEIFYSVEQELRQQYSEDQLTDRGQIYVVYRAIESGYFSTELEIGLNEKQKNYLLKLAKLNQLELSIIRRDCLIYDVTIQLEIKNLILALFLLALKLQHLIHSIIFPKIYIIYVIYKNFLLF
jgi:hypothetical protein